MQTLAHTFDYAVLETADRVVVQQKTGEIRDRMGRAVQNIVEIGERLLVVKEKLGHGQFGKWLDGEFGWTDRTARNFMGVARHFKSETVSDLNLSARTLYLLASDSVPDDVRDQFIEAAKAGEQVTHAEVKAAVFTQADADRQKAELDAVDPLLLKYGRDGTPKSRGIARDEESAIFIGNDFPTAPKSEPEPAYETHECDRLETLIASGQKFGCILADPPWKYGNQATRASTDNHYPTMTVEEISALPVGELAADDAHLHLWVTNGFLFEAKAILDAWGFEFRSTFVWCKPQMGIGNYWRNSHEILLTAIRGDAKRFNDRSLKSWEVFDRTAHSAKPDKVHEYIERASPGPRLELFGRKMVHGWTVWGNQIERGMFDPTKVAV